jgi:protein TonB
MPIGRIIIGIPIAGAITFSLFILMMTLVANRTQGPDDGAEQVVIDFVRMKRDEQSNTRADDLARPEDTQLPPPPPPPAAKPPSDLQTADGGSTVGLGDFGALRVSALTDSDALPEFRAQPTFPDRAYRAKIEGWVDIQFDVEASGAVTNVVAIRAQPEGYFEKAAIKSVKRWKYAPAKSNNQKIRRRGLVTRIRFTKPQEGW